VKKQEMLMHLKSIAEKVGLSVRYENLGQTRGGFVDCTLTELFLSTRVFLSFSG
jgi:hypothetical protein